MQAHTTVSREEWLEARRALLAKEKEVLKAKDELRHECARSRRTGWRSVTAFPKRRIPAIHRPCDDGMPSHLPVTIIFQSQ